MLLLRILAISLLGISFGLVSCQSAPPPQPAGETEEIGLLNLSGAEERKNEKTAQDVRRAHQENRENALQRSITEPGLSS